MVQGPLRSARRQRESSALLGIADRLPQDKKIFQPRLSGGAFFRWAADGFCCLSGPLLRLHDQVLHDVLAAARRIFTHVELQHRTHIGKAVNPHWL